jgi:hypothetical protein
VLFYLGLRGCGVEKRRNRPPTHERPVPSEEHKSVPPLMAPKSTEKNKKVKRSRAIKKRKWYERRAVTLFKVIFDIVIVHDDIEPVLMVIVVKT